MNVKVKNKTIIFILILLYLSFCVTRIQNGFRTHDGMRHCTASHLCMWHMGWHFVGTYLDAPHWCSGTRQITLIRAIPAFDESKWCPGSSHFMLGGQSNSQSVIRRGLSAAGNDGNLCNHEWHYIYIYCDIYDFCLKKINKSIYTQICACLYVHGTHAHTYICEYMHLPALLKKSAFS